MALAILSGLGRGIEHIAYAQMWDLAPSVQIQSQSANNLQLNKNVLQPSDSNNNVNNKNSIASNCITTESNIINASVASRSSSSLTFSAPKTSSNCDPQSSSSSSSGQLSKFHNHPCIKLKVKNSGGLKVPAAETIRYGNVIKAISTPPGGTDVPPPMQVFTMNIQEVCGTNNDDYIIGSEGNDVIFGLRGNDIITALNGDDIVFAGPGDDIVYGGDGNNQLFGEDGNDNLVGGTQDDLIVGGPGNDRLYGNAGDDILQGGPGADFFDCGDGLDTVVDYTPTQGDVISSNYENVNLIHHH
ncbi:MAG TPA: calcium-binding protein [Nitrososphaeraceae archaeon]